MAGSGLPCNIAGGMQCKSTMAMGAMGAEAAAGDLQMRMRWLISSWHYRLVCGWEVGCPHALGGLPGMRFAHMEQLAAVQLHPAGFRRHDRT